VRKKSIEPDLQDTLEHILTICTIYECSSDKVGRIIQYTKHVLEEVKASKKRESLRKVGDKDAKRKRD
jgi:hypothetical protein